MFRPCPKTGRCRPSQDGRFQPEARRLKRRAVAFRHLPPTPEQLAFAEKCRSAVSKATCKSQPTPALCTALNALAESISLGESAWSDRQCRSTPWTRLRALDYRFMATNSATQTIRRVYVRVADQLDRRAVATTVGPGKMQSFTLSSPALYGLPPWIRFRPRNAFGQPFR